MGVYNRKFNIINYTFTMDFCIKTLGQILSQFFLWLSAAVSLLAGNDFLDDSVKYAPLVIAIISLISYMGLTRIKKRKERLDIELKKKELKNLELDNEIKKKQLENLNDDEI